MTSPIAVMPAFIWPQMEMCATGPERAALAVDRTQP